MKRSFEGKTCVVTGASTGIGFGLSKLLLERGATVWLCSRTPANIMAAREKLAEFKGRAHFDVVDVRYADQVTQYINRVAEKGPIDYLFNNAGVGYKGHFEEATSKDWHDILSCNLCGVIHGVTAVVPIMLRQGGGNIINTASVCGIVPLPYQTVYDASKHAVVGFSEALRHEMADRNIRVWAVCPGAVDTMIFRRASDYSIVPGLDAPPESISPAQAAEEILTGLDTYRGILPITDFARKMYEAIYVNEDTVEKAMLSVKKDVESVFAKTAPADKR